MSQNMFVTGATGVLGRRLLGQLGSAFPDWNVIPVAVDLRDPEAVASFCEKSPFPDLLFHLAAIVPTVRVDEDPLDAYMVNAIGTGRILGGMLARNPSLWGLYVSSSHVYASGDSALSEESPLSPMSAYGRTKLAGELVAADLFAARPDAHLCVARVFSMYSPDQNESFLFPKLLSLKRSSGNGLAQTVKGWDNVRDFLPADDVAGHLVNLCLGRAEGVYNVGSGVGVTVASFARAILGLEVELSDATRSPKKSVLVAEISKYERYLDEIGTPRHDSDSHS